ncbi:MAG: methionyl-tRNA formyltransferase [Pseudomonadales bacterium]|nr:methionyl-tRNA formyltransferase [Pseudomonadales bacterium]
MSRRQPSETPLRIIFAGTPTFAAAQLQVLIDSRHTVVAVYTQPDRPAGRGKKQMPGPVKQLAEAHHLPVYQPLSLKDEEAQTLLDQHQADIMIVVAYGMLLPKAVLDMPKLGCINIHASLLPRWRGAAPIQRAIEAGDVETGITFMQMDEGLDTGDMLKKIPCQIEPDETAASLHDKLATLAKKTLLTLIDELASGSINRVKQDNALGCYAEKINKSEAVIDWSLDAAIIERKVRAFNPFPICFSEMEGTGRIRVWEAAVSRKTDDTPPSVIFKVDSTGIQVACGKDALVIKQLQLPGKRPITAKDALNSYADIFLPGKRFT